MILGLNLFEVGFLLAGLFNVVGMAFVSIGYTNEVLFAVYPSLFSREGCYVITLMGFVYASVAFSYFHVRSGTHFLRLLCGILDDSFMRYTIFFTIHFAICIDMSPIHLSIASVNCQKGIRPFRRKRLEYDIDL